MTRPKQDRRPEQGRRKALRTQVRGSARSGSRLCAKKRGKRVAGWVVYDTTGRDAGLLRAEGLSQGNRREPE